MSDYDSMAEEIRANKEKMKEHTGGERLAFFFLYYKWPFAAVLFVIIVLVFLIRSCSLYQVTPYVSGAFINSNATAMIEKSYEKEYASAIGLADGTLDICYDFSMNYNAYGENPKSAIDTPILMLAHSEAADMDFCLINEKEFEFFAANGYFVDLRQVLDAELLSRVSDSIWYMTYKNDPGEYPIAIKLTRDIAPYLWESGIYTDDTPVVYYSVFFTSTKKARCAEWLIHILDNDVPILASEE